MSKLVRKTKLQGFTLVELLVVVAIMGILLVLVSLGFQSILGTAFDSEISDLSNILVRARAYAMANNTYVFVGIEEVDGSVASTTTPQVAGKGRIGVVVVATNDGSKGYDSTSVSTSTTIPTTTGTSFIVVSPLRHFENMDILDLTGTTTFATAPQPPTYSGFTGSCYNLANPFKVGSSTGSSSSTSLTKFTWPVGGTQYTFGPNASSPGSVIQFNPQGEASIYTQKYGDTYLQWIEIDLQPTHGNTVPGTVTNAAAILIDGASGAVTVYRK
jgi:prepilin-type N-terminal cleavage/methylation domain-containing protein